MQDVVGRHRQVPGIAFTPMVAIPHQWLANHRRHPAAFDNRQQERPIDERSICSWSGITPASAVRRYTTEPNIGSAVPRLEDASHQIRGRRKLLIGRKRNLLAERRRRRPLLELLQLRRDEPAGRIGLEYADRRRDVAGREQVVLVEGHRVFGRGRW